jgi:arylsulfatase A
MKQFLPSSLILALTSLFVLQPTEADAAERPNFVIILADDMGYGDASCYDNFWLSTPNLERLAQQGMRFTDFHSSCPVCSPTRAGLLTGRYQQRAGVPGVIFADPKQNRHHGLHDHEVTFSKLLSDAGYQTAVFGKWHLGYQKKFNPMHHKFDQFRGYVSGNVCFISHCDRMGVADWWNGLKLEPEIGYCTHLITKHAVNFIKQNKDKPFCLYVAHEAVHSPYQGPNDKPVRGVGKGRIKGNERKDIKAAYREMMTEMDKGIGEVVAALTEQGIAENTLLFFFSDNGATKNGSNGNLHGFKGSLWEGGHRVPAVAYWPGKIKPGSVSRETAISIDLMPTMLDLANVELPKGHRLDGVSLAGVLTQGKKLDERLLYWDYRNKSAVRDGAWKLLVGEQGQGANVGLYNLADDISEKNNLAKQHPEKVSTLQIALKNWKKEITSRATQQPKK